MTATQRDESNFQAWDLDALGNWAGFNDAAAGLEQTREHNAANEVVSLGQGTGQAQWIDPVHDAAGNMTQAPVDGQETRRLHLAYDAWNRLAGASWDTGGEAVAWLVTYSYDPAGRRIVRQTPVERQDLYYNEAWQVVEVQRDGQAHPLEQWVWNSRYVDAAVVRFYDANTDGDYGDDGDNVLYPIHDANWNVTGVVDAAAGGVAERYVYTPYGARKVLSANWSADEGGQSGLAFASGHQGGRIDLVTGYIHFRHREFCSALGRWLTRDPLGYVDGMSVYQYVRSAPLVSVDPAGLAFVIPGRTARPMTELEHRRYRYITQTWSLVKELENSYAALRPAVVELYNAARAVRQIPCPSYKLVQRMRELAESVRILGNSSWAEGETARKWSRLGLLDPDLGILGMVAVTSGGKMPALRSPFSGTGFVLGVAGGAASMGSTLRMAGSNGLSMLLSAGSALSNFRTAYRSEAPQEALVALAFGEADLASLGLAAVYGMGLPGVAVALAQLAYMAAMAEIELQAVQRVSDEQSYAEKQWDLRLDRVQKVFREHIKKVYHNRNLLHDLNATFFDDYLWPKP